MLLWTYSRLSLTNFMKIIIIVLITLCFDFKTAMAQSPAAGQETKPAELQSASLPANPRYQQMPLRELVANIKSEKDNKTKAEMAAGIAKRVPANKQDVDDLFNAVEAGKDNNSDPLSRSAQMALANTVDPSLAPEFSKRVKKGSLYTRTTAIGMVAKFKYKPAVPKLIDMVEDYGKRSLLQDDYEDTVRISAALALGEIGDERAIPALIKKLGKMDSYEAKALGQFGKKALPQLLEVARNSKDKVAVGGACNAVEFMEDREVIAELWTILNNEKDTARFIALGPLLKITDESTIPSRKEAEDYLFALAKKDKRFIADTIAVAQKNKDVGYLIKVFNDVAVGHAYRTGAIIALGEIGDSAAIPALEDALKNSDKEIRRRAAKALYQMTGKEYK